MAALLLAAGCDYEPLPPPPPAQAQKVFLMYDNINNDPGKPFTENVNAAGRAVANGALDRDERVVVFEQTASGNVIYELVKDISATKGFVKKEWKKYKQGENTGLDVESMRRVVGDVRSLFSDTQSWGFAFGSHGLGWLPRSNTQEISRKIDRTFDPSVPEHTTRYFRGYGKLDVSEFVEALRGWKWDFIILDDCFMAGVEPMYEMRSLAKYIIASPTEIMLYGFPYDRVVTTVFDDWSESGFVSVAREFVDYYKSQPSHRSATVAVVKMEEMGLLALAVKKLNLRENEVTTTEGIQHYEAITKPSHLFYDLDDYLRTIRAASTPVLYNEFTAQLKRTVIFKDHTETFWSAYRSGQGGREGTFITVDHYSGLDVFIPWRGTASMMDMYRQTDWYKIVYAAE